MQTTVEATTTPTEEVPEYLDVGLSKKEVKNIMGTPTEIFTNSKGEEIWFYNSSRVWFDDDKVSDFDNISENLKIEGEKENVEH